MKKLVFLTAATAFTLSASAASAAMLKNSSSEEFKFWSEINGKKQEQSLKPGESYDSKGKDVKIIYGEDNKEELSAKAGEHLIFKDGKLEHDMSASAKGSVGDVKEQSPAAGKSMEHKGSSHQ